MRPLSIVQPPAPRRRALPRLALAVMLVLLGVPGWTGIERLPLFPRDMAVSARRYVPASGWPRRIGQLVPIGGLRLSGDDPAFGGFSALSIRDGAATLLNDGGNYVRIRIDHGAITTRASGFLPSGPGTGWQKETRDSESLAVDPATGRLWVGFERANAIWRYAPSFARAEAGRAPAAMRNWRSNGGAESMVRLADGRFVVIAEQPRPWGSRVREGLIFPGDPAVKGTMPERFRYRPPPGFSPTDAAQLPDGDLVVLNRSFHYPLRFSAKLVRVRYADLRAGGVARGREIATLAPPLVTENCEGLAITREGGRTMLWIVTDNDAAWYRPTLLLKFALDNGPSADRLQRETARRR